MWATFAGTPSLFLRKSTMRYCCLWPPPRCREVLRPATLRPPVFGLGASRLRSGSARVSSAKSETVWNRRPGLVGLRERRAIRSSRLEEVDLVAVRQRDDRALGVLAAPDAVGAAVADGLALATQGIDLLHLHAEGLLDGEAHVDLRRVDVDLEHVDEL